MTYEELANKIAGMTEEQKKSDVTVFHHGYLKCDDLSFLTLDYGDEENFEMPYLSIQKL